MKSHRCAFSPSPNFNLRSFRRSCFRSNHAPMDTPVSVHRRNSDVFVKLSVLVHFLFVEVTLQHSCDGWRSARATSRCGENGVELIYVKGIWTDFLNFQKCLPTIKSFRFNSTLADGRIVALMILGWEQRQNEISVMTKICSRFTPWPR